jgi:predicted DNA-binding WGR domain protein
MARYLGVSAGKWKYWEIHVEGGVVTLDEGALGTLGKRTVHTFPDEAAARKDAAAREKKVLAKGYTLQPEPTNLAADLFAAFAPCFVEAQRGDPARAATKALAALQARDLAEPKELGMCPVLLARRGHADVAQQVLDAFEARRADFTGERLAGHLALVAAGHLALGHGERFDAAADEAFACLPAWSTTRAWPAYLGAEGVALAEALLDRGRREDARALFGALGYFGLDALLARGRLDWYDEVAPGALTDSSTRDRYRLARAAAEGRETFARTFAAMVDEDLGAMSTREAEGRLLWLAIALRDARDGDLAASLVGTLRRAVHQHRGAHAHSELCRALWIAAAHLAHLGHDVCDELAWASTPSALALAATQLHWQAPKAAVMTRVAERLRALPVASAPGDVGWAVDAVVVRARLGEVITSAALRDLAALTGRAYLALGELAAVALAQGDRALGWELLGLAKSRDLSSVAGVARRRLAAWAMIGPYKTLCDAIPPWGTFDPREESLLLAAVLDGA